MFSVLLLHFSSVGKCGTTVYKGDTTTNYTTRQFVSLGGLFPLSKISNDQCGSIQRFGLERAEAMVFAIRTINTNNSILPQVNLTFDIRDTCTISNIALERAIEYVQSDDALCSNKNATHVSGVLGASRSDVSVSVASLFRLFQIPQISYASTAARLSNKRTFDYFFRTVPSDMLQAKAMADLIVYFNWTYIFTIYSNDTYGREGIDSLINELRSRNNTKICIALREALPLGSSDNAPFDSVLEKMSQDWIRNASVAVLFGHRDEGIGMIRAISGMSNNSSLRQITWIASDSWAVALPDNEDYRRTARGMLSTVQQPRVVDEFMKYFADLNPISNVANPWFSEYWESVFNCSLDTTVLAFLVTQELKICLM